MYKFEKTKELTIEQLKNDVYGKHWEDQSWHEVLRLICGMIDEKWTKEIIIFLTSDVANLTFGLLDLLVSFLLEQPKIFKFLCSIGIKNQNMRYVILNMIGGVKLCPYCGKVRLLADNTCSYCASFNLSDHEQHFHYVKIPHFSEILQLISGEEIFPVLINWAENDLNPMLRERAKKIIKELTEKKKQA